MKPFLLILILALCACGVREDEDSKLYSRSVVGCCVFPFSHRAANDYTIIPYVFGSLRANGRRHAADDLLAPRGEPVYAVDDGVIVDYYPFYEGTDCVVVIHKDGFVVRYSEIKGMNGFKIGSKVKKGQKITKVGLLASGSSMLHFEKYSGKLNGPLTVRENWPYQRRGDLQNPTKSLLAWPYPR